VARLSIQFMLHSAAQKEKKRPSAKWGGNLGLFIYLYMHASRDERNNKVIVVCSTVSKLSRLVFKFFCYFMHDNWETSHEIEQRLQTDAKFR